MRYFTLIHEFYFEHNEQYPKDRTAVYPKDSDVLAEAAAHSAIGTAMANPNVESFYIRAYNDKGGQYVEKWWNNPVRPEPEPIPEEQPAAE